MFYARADNFVPLECFLMEELNELFFLLFQSGKYGKINKCVTFPDMLDMVPFVTGSGDNPPLYFLYAVVVHVDTENASFSGHYISYVKDMQGTWLRIDDSEVRFTTRSTPVK